jgi:hypothetical protein
MRRKPRPEPDADLAAVFEEAGTIERLSGYYMRACDPPIPGAENCDEVAEIRALAMKHRGHPAAEKVLSTFESTATMREEARR